VSSPKGCQGYSSNDGLECAIFILALSLKLLLTADVTAKLLFFAPYSGYCVPPGPPPWWNSPSPLGGNILYLIPASPNTESEGQALSVSLVKPGAYLSVS
jgi:hypothetical protein